MCIIFVNLKTSFAALQLRLLQKHLYLAAGQEDPFVQYHVWHVHLPIATEEQEHLYLIVLQP